MLRKLKAVSMLVYGGVLKGISTKEMEVCNRCFCEFGELLLSALSNLI